MKKIFSQKVFSLILVVILGFFILYTFYSVADIEPEMRLADHYIERGVEETKAINLITAILFDYRAFDTLGEATVIFTAASVVAMLLPLHRASMLRTEFTPVVHQSIAFILPFLWMISIFLVFYGHLSPGGGFSGGVIISAISILIIFTYGFKYMTERFNVKKLSLIEDAGALTFLLIGCLGIIAGGTFLANSQAGLYLGEPGELLSGGIIPLSNLAVGAKVGTGLSVIFISLARED